jgi:predicted RNase H-like nuclease
VNLSTSIVGVDGCRAGWVCAQRQSGVLSLHVVANFRELLVHWGGIVGIDVPIGLMESGSRTADVLARQALGWPRRCSVFPAPLRPMLAAKNWAEASALRRRIEGKGLSRQSWSIMEKIREVDAALREAPADRERVFEIHPELSFWEMGGGAPMGHGKKSRAGRIERLRLLAPFGLQEADVMVRSRTLGCKPDDLLDAVAALWTAERIGRGKAGRFPPAKIFDTQGIRMAIWV